MSAFRNFFARIRASAVKRPLSVKTVAMERERIFDAYDCGDDTFIFERGISKRLKERPSVLLVEKRALGRRAKGRVLTMSTGNHSVAAFPLLDGRFWRLSRVKSERRSEVLKNFIVCANIVGDRLELSQREVPTPRLVATDEWLLNQIGFALNDIVMLERKENTLEHYRRLGMEWRVKPLAWTENEMKAALSASRKRIATKLRYYHSSLGVHLMSFAEFRRFAALAESDPQAFIAGLKELVSVFEGNRTSFTRMIKHRGHHEIEFFGLRRGVALERLVPELERMMEAVALNRLGNLGLIQRSQEVVRLYESLLTSPELADESSKTFIETIYMYVTGEIYAVQGEGSTPAFDDRRTALPGATFKEGRAVLHPGADERTEILMSNIRGLLSKDEIIEYANVYELRGEEEEAISLGKGTTREIVYKTNCRPLETSLIEKELAHTQKGYTEYMLARIGALRALGIGLSDYYRVLKRRAGKGRGTRDYYIRRRCEGEPMEAIPANYFRSGELPTTEEPEVVLALASLMGDAAAQNLTMKKYDPKTASPLFGIGKEIYEFEYDLRTELVVPKKVTLCSIRGSFGWPSLEFTDENLNRLFDFYLSHFAAALRQYAARHPGVAADAIARRFLEGFEYRIHAMSWQLSVMRDRFETFSPQIPKSFGFAERWRFVLWSLERQERRLDALEQLFIRYFQTLETNKELVPSRGGK